ncbi:MAG: rhodanese-like domain-containing protein [Xanthobacteraceae bacterium]|nr:rhodanese-like domain-containing protein [Xanthobacteraceae bacterium]
MVEPDAVRDLTPQEVAAGLEAGRILLVDVREPQETATERIPGSVLLPLSRFDPDDIPDPQGRAVVFTCAVGMRSLRAAETALAAGYPYDAHLVGGLKSWKAAGFPTER